MLRLTGKLHSEGPGGAGFATAILDPLALGVDLAVWRAAFNPMHTNTGLTEENWKTFFGSTTGVSATLNDLLTRMNNAISAPAGGVRGGNEETLIGRLGDKINLVSDQVRLSADGFDLLAAVPNKANPSGGFAEYDKARAFDESPGVFSRNTLFRPRGTSLLPDKDITTPEWEAAVQPHMRVDMTLAWTRAQKDAKFWGPNVFKDVGGVADPRNRIPGAVSLQRTINSWAMAYFFSLQPQMVMAHCLWRFLFGGAAGPSSSPAYDTAIRRVDKRSLDDVNTMLTEICTARIGLTPIWARALQPMGWRKMDLRWGEMQVCFLPPELAGFEDVGDLLLENSRTINFIRRLYRTLKRDNLIDLYTSLNVWMGMIQPLSDYTPPPPLEAGLYYTDGLHTSATLKHELDMWFTPIFKANDHIGVATDRPATIDIFEDFEANRSPGQVEPLEYDDQPTLQFEPNASTSEGSIQELGTPAKWRLLNGDYQGDLGEMSIPGDIESMASMIGVEPGVLLDLINAQFNRWEHLYAKDKDSKIVPRIPGARFFRSLRTELWWRKSFKPNAQLVQIYLRWLDGKRLLGNPAYTAEAARQGNMWYGLRTAERADLNSTIEGAFTSLKALL